MRYSIAAAAVLASADAQAQPALTAADVAHRIDATYGSIKTFEADFDEHVDINWSSTTQRSGHVAFERGGKMRWDYTTPAGDVVFSDGTTLYSYEAAANVAYRMVPRRAAKPAALAFLDGNLAGAFNLALMDATKLKATPGYVLKAVPKVTTTAFNFALFYVTPTFAVRKVLLVDSKDRRTRIDFSKPTFNPALATSTFAWSPPASAKIVTIP
jgi:outer membrane lipoprotein-sorting protein